MATSYANTGGTGDRTAIITTSTTCTLTGSVTNLVDGAKANNTTDSCFFTGSTADGLVIKFDFGVGASKVIDEAKWYQNGSSAQGTWKWQGSNDDSGWTDLSIGFTLDAGSGGAVIGDLSANVTGYRYYRIIKTGGTTNSTPWLYEIEFKIDDAAPTEADLVASASVGVLMAVDMDASAIPQVAASVGLEMAVAFSNVSPGRQPVVCIFM